MRKKGCFPPAYRHSRPPFSRFGTMKLNRLLPTAIFLGLFCVYAQAYEAETNEAWIASQTGGNTELNDGNDEPNPDCIGDGCGEEATPVKTAEKTRKMWQDEDAKGPKDEDECTPADSLLPECRDESEDEDDDNDGDEDTYDRYVNDNSDISRASREGFSSGFSLGFRVAGGLSKMFLLEEFEDWSIGYEITGGIVTLTKLGNSGLSTTAELSFSYYRYRYKADFEYDDYSEEDEADLTAILFEVPIVLKYAIGGSNLTFGLGVNLGLKLTGNSKFKQTIETSTLTETDTSNEDLLPTAGVEVGGIFEIGYSINKNVSIDLRLNQRVLNLLNQDVVAVTSMTGMKLLPTHGTIGISLFL